VIDGQQRLTTMQLLISAMREVAAEMELSNQEKALGEMLFHAEHHIEEAPAHHRYRVWPTLYDREVFGLVLETHGTAHLAAGGYGKHAIASAEMYFREQIEAWVKEEADAGDRELRLRALVRVVQRLLRLVVIELDSTDNAQLIFETLNARGEDLLAAELVKNYLFAQADKPGVDLVSLYDGHWKAFEGGAWRELVGVGRRKRPRVEQFLFHWLAMQTADDEVSPDRLFPFFRRWMRETTGDAISVLEQFSQDGDLYLGFTHPQSVGAESAAVQGRFFERLDILDTNTPTPLVLWLHRPQSDVPADRRLRALEAIESWLVRRALCRYTTRAYNQFFLEILREAKAATEAGNTQLDEIVIGELASKSGQIARAWPTDAEIRDALLDKPLYGPVNQRRIRMVLLAIEDVLRQRTEGKAEQVSLGTSLHIEHLVPQAWEEHWVPFAPGHFDSDAAAAWRQQWMTEHREHRDFVLHSIGNLTLLTEPLNESVSNGPWEDKRSSIDEYSAFRLNRDIVLKYGTDGWDEEQVHNRSNDLIDLIIEIWPGPSAEAWSTPAVASAPNAVGE
jgi:hypothetical protein